MYVNTSRCDATPFGVLALTLFAAIGLPFQVDAQPATSPSLGGASTFVVLGRDAVTNSGASTFGGDVGANVGGTIAGVTDAMLAPGSAQHQGDAVAAQAYHDALAAYSDLSGRPCLPGNTNPVLDGQSLASGIYCFTGDAVLNTTLTLTGAGPWLFQIDGALTVAPAATVVAPVVSPATCGGTNVFWQVGDDDPATAVTPAVIGAGATFVGNILALGDVSFGSAAHLDGRAFSLGARAGASGGAVTTSANALAACSNGQPLPVHPAFKVTGGGSINVPNNPAESDPEATGTGFANYGFNGQPGVAGAAATGTFNYVNHVVAPNFHINGPVTQVAVVAVNSDGTPKTARVSGSCNAFLPTCSFSILTEDNGEPPVDDRFGITIVSNGQVVEARSLRLIRNGNIQFHSAALTTSVNAPTLRVGQVMRLSARLRRDRTATPADAYVVLQAPDGQIFSWTQAGLVPGLVPLVRNFVPVDVDGEILQVLVPAGTPPGIYKWLSALTEAGTFNLLTTPAERSVTITP
jgi:Ice-binding-like